MVRVLFSSNLYYRTLFSDRIIVSLKKLPDFSISQVGKILLQVDFFTNSVERVSRFKKRAACKIRVITTGYRLAGEERGLIFRTAVSNGV